MAVSVGASLRLANPATDLRIAFFPDPLFTKVYQICKRELPPSELFADV